MRTSVNQQFSNTGQQVAQSQAPLSSHPPSGHSTLTRHQISQVVNQLSSVRHHQGQQQGGVDSGAGPGRSGLPGNHQIQSASKFEPRIVMPVMKKSGDLGVRLVRF